MTPQRRRDEPERPWLVWAVVGAVTLVACVVVVVVLGGGGGGEDAATDGGDADGRTQYEQHCANCHGIDGQGAIGPALSQGRVVERFPDADDQARVVAEGRPDLGMPPFSQTLSDDQIDAVVAYTRTL